MEDANKGGPALEGVVVTELGGREAVGICGSLLAQLGATVIVVEPADQVRPRDAFRAQRVAGKLSFAFDSQSKEDRELLDELVERSDVVLAASDLDTADFQAIASRARNNILCDLTAFGSSGPRAGEALGELELQALCGIMDTTGMPDGPPLPIGVPIVGYVTGASAAAAILAALRVKRRQGFGQRIEVAMFDAAFAALHVFLLGLKDAAPGSRRRMGNRHPTTAAWNLFECRDGRVLICAGSQSHWLKLCALMHRADLAEKFKTAGSRMQGIDEIDAAIEAWTRTLDTAECVERLIAAGVAAGPIAPIDRYPREANLDFRGMIRTLHDPVGGERLHVPASPLALRGSPPVQPESIPAPGADRAEIVRILRGLAAPDPATPAPSIRERPLAGVRIIEVGQYTTAPLCARHLAHLGADVIKIEKPGGDESRTLEPRLGDRSEAYCLNNADKRSVVLDLQSPAGMDALKALLRTADVLVENSKPGTLARFGLSDAELAGINPRLVHCAISGFGAVSLYDDRPGFDTVIQAVSGFMTAVNPGGVPLKSGISTADLMGSQLGCVAILGALEYRDRTGRGQFIDLSMQDVACWLTAAVWNTELAAIPRPAVLPCADGFLLAETGQAQLAGRLGDIGLTRDRLAAMNRAEAIACLSRLDLKAVPVNSVTEVRDLPQTQARRLWFSMPAEGREWPMVASPMRLHLTPPEIVRHGSGLDEDGPAILRSLGLA